jgi:response regulator RpfG family c-di-GMP phosphodiesterase
MPNPLQFLIVDENRDNRFLLARTLARKFPAAKIIETGDSDVACTAVADPALSLAIVHRSAHDDCAALIRRLRPLNPRLPLLAVSGYDRREQVMGDGANGFLHYDAWLSVGRVVEELLKDQAGAAPPPRAS